jgi:hypothetical protein
MGLSRPDPTGLVKFISKWAGCQVSGKPGWDSCSQLSCETGGGASPFPGGHRRGQAAAARRGWRNGAPPPAREAGSRSRLEAGVSRFCRAWPPCRTTARSCPTILGHTPRGRRIPFPQATFIIVEGQAAGLKPKRVGQLLAVAPHVQKIRKAPVCVPSGAREVFPWIPPMRNPHL